MGRNGYGIKTNYYTLQGISAAEKRESGRGSCNRQKRRQWQPVQHLPQMLQAKGFCCLLPVHPTTTTTRFALCCLAFCLVVASWCCCCLYLATCESCQRSWLIAIPCNYIFNFVSISINRLSCCCSYKCLQCSFFFWLIDWQWNNPIQFSQHMWEIFSCW